jgi:hypothetical protein
MRVGRLHDLVANAMIGGAAPSYRGELFEDAHGDHIVPGGTIDNE